MSISATGFPSRRSSISGLAAFVDSSHGPLIALRLEQGRPFSSFGNSHLLTRWSPDIKRDFAKRYREQQWTIDTSLYPIRLVRERTLERHPLLEQWGQPIDGKPLNYADLMFRESEIIVSTMLRLAREHGIPSMPVHDSLIVPLSEADTSKRLLEEQFGKFTAVRPTLKVRTLYDF
jgi:hypothetical protein